MSTLQPYQTPGQPAPVAPVAGPSMFVKALPFAVNTAVAVVAHQWHYEGAAHSIGDAVICGGAALAALCIGAALSKVESIPPAALALAYGTGGALIGVEVIGYTQAPALALLAWLAGTVVSYALAKTGWVKRSDRREERAHEREMLALREQAKTERAQIKAGAQVSVARELSAAWAAERLAVDSFNARYPSSVPVFGAVPLRSGQPAPAALDVDAEFRALTSGTPGFVGQGDGLDIPEWLLDENHRRDQP